MARCTHFDSCPIGNEKVSASPEVIDFMRGHFCNDRYTKCRLYNAATDICAKAPDGEINLAREVMLCLVSGRV